MGTLSALNFDNSYGRLPDRFYQRIGPKALTNPHLISFNTDVAALLDLDPCQVTPFELATYLGTAQLLPGSDPLAMKYAGHQFGFYNKDLGDGRGLLLGEVVNQAGQRWDLHLKGAGTTAFSRFGDGRAVLRSSVREYLASAALQGMGIATTQALALIGSETYTQREGMEPCARVLRVSQCHIRFGHFEHFYYTGQHEDLRRLADYCLARFFPALAARSQPYLAMLTHICQQSAQLVAHWQAYGFVHGVLNSDNMSILSETFDYGPFTLMDQYRPDTVSNYNDHQGRYAFAQQPAIVHWNLSCLAQALSPLIDEADLRAALAQYPAHYQQGYYQLMAQRLGVEPDERGLVDRFITLISEQRCDLNRLLYRLTEVDVPCDLARLQGPGLLQPTAAAQEWLNDYQHITRQGRRLALMQQRNPRYILRNYMAQEAILAAQQGDYRLVNQQLALLRHPHQIYPDLDRYAGPPPDWAGGIALSCSS